MDSKAPDKSGEIFGNMIKNRDVSSSFLDNSNEMIIVVDKARRIVKFNKTAEKTFGYAESEVIGKNVVMLYANASESEKPAQTMQARGEFHGWILNKRRNGEIFRSFVSASQIKDLGGNIIGIMGISREEATIGEVVAKGSAIESVRELLNGSRAAVYVKGEDGKFVMVNKRFLELHNLEEDAVVGKTGAEVFPVSFAQKLWKSEQKLFREVKPFDREDTEIVDGRPKVFLTSCFPILDKEGRPYAVCGLSIDITDRKKREEDLISAKENAEKATVLKDKMLSLVSHDLKGPLATIISTMRVLISTPKYGMGDEALKLVNSSISTGESLMKLIESLLDIGRLKTGALKPVFGFEDMHYLIARNFDYFFHLAASKGIEVVNDVPRRTRIYVDSALYHEVVRNLLSNAIKFSNRGGKVRLYLPYGEKTSLAVSDSGVGISPDIIESLFDYQIKTSSVGTGGELGTGMGLPLCKEIATALGGNLVAESAVGAGSTFYFSVPEVKPEVLIVDDDKFLRKLLSKLIGTLNVEIRIANSCPEAEEMINESQPHLILASTGTENACGLELLQKIRSNHLTASLPFIALMPSGEIVKKDEMFRAGANDFITKPFVPEDLLPRIRKLIV
ncbi:MAG: PAS domain S-box protein [Nitrospinota bacterium]|nr:PAS domain S-box protein [Nitrospinota bacterium]